MIWPIPGADFSEQRVMVRRTSFSVIGRLYNGGGGEFSSFVAKLMEVSSVFDLCGMKAGS